MTTLRSGALLAGCPAEGIDLFEGVYLMYPGPNFETPAEIGAFTALGAPPGCRPDGHVHTVPECLVAIHCGMRVAAVSVLTNLAVGMDNPVLTQDDTLARAILAVERLARLLLHFLPRI